MRCIKVDGLAIFQELVGEAQLRNDFIVWRPESLFRQVDLSGGQGLSGLTAEQTPPRST